MNRRLAARHAGAIGQWLGPVGRMIPYSKTAYMDVHSDHAVVFNANVCFQGGKVWWGDIDLTEDEPELTRLAAATGEIVYVLSEADGRFENEDAPLLDRADFSVTPSGQTSILDPVYVRRTDGVLVVRTEDPKRLPSVPDRPRPWRFWRIELREVVWDGARAADGVAWTSLLFGGSGVDGGPHLALRVYRFRHVARGGWLEVGWYPSGARRPWAPPIHLKRKWEHGTIRPWIGVDLAPGAGEEIRIGVTVGPRDPRWG